MSNDPLKPGPVRAFERMPPEPDVHGEEDHSPFWLRIVHSLRPTASIEVDKKTGKRVGVVGIEGGTDF